MPGRNRILLAVLAVIAAALSSCGGDGSNGASCGGGAELGGIAYAERTVRITAADGKARTGCVFVADTQEERAHGLMDVTDLEGRVGMVFVFDAEVKGRFYMKNTPMPLSIAWFGGDGAFVSSADMPPCQTDADCPTYGASAPYRYALEVPQGRLGSLGVGPGARLELEG